MPKAKFKCKRCKRSFSMAAHLARHMNTIHASKKLKATKAKSKKKKAAARATTAPVRAFSTGVGGRKEIIAKMKAHQSDLLTQRRSLTGQMDALARAIAAIDGATPTRGTRSSGKKRGRPVKAVGSAGSLKSYIDRVLRESSKPMSLKDIGKRVKKAGYKSKAKDLTKAVSNALPGLKKVTRVGYGKYQLIG